MATKSQVMARRIGRTVFGSVLIIGAIWMIAAALPGRDRDVGLDCAQVLGLTWLIAICAGGLAWGLARWRRVSGGVDRLFAQSVMIPAAGLALLLPLSLHCLVMLVLADLQDFDMWVRMAGWFTGTAHAALVIACLVRGHQLITGKPAWSLRQIYVGVVLVACLPFACLVAPPILVAVTGVFFLPVLYAMARTVRREREALAGAPDDLPRAVVRGPGAGPKAA